MKVTCAKEGNFDYSLNKDCLYLDRCTKYIFFFRVIEMGPSTAQFKVPVLLEVPHFASVRGGERELIVLRCDDGETWREHTTAYLQTGWQGGDEEIYADFVASTGG